MVIAPVQIITLSLVQGITEFMPISSSAHLLMISKILGWQDQGLIMDVAVHLGSLVAAILYFFSDVVSALRGSIDFVTSKKNKRRKLFLAIVISTLPIVLVGYFLKDTAMTTFRTHNMIVTVAWASILFGALLWLVDIFAKAKKGGDTISKGQALFLGCLQILALVPGVSRSGIYMTGARMLGIKRTESVRISTLFGLPVLFAASALVAIELYNARDIALTTQAGVATLISFCASMASIRFMMLWFKKSTMTPFAIYRIFFGITLLLYFA